MRGSLLFALAAAAGCASSVAPDPGLEGLALDKVAPATLVPGSKLVVKGASFVDEEWGETTLHLVGKAGGQNVDLSWPAKFVDFSTMTVSIDASMIDELGGDIDFAGEVSVEVVATSNGETYATEAIPQDLSFRRKLIPTPTGIVDGVIFVNDQIAVDGDGFLLGGDEGTTFARVTGCFQPDGSATCTPVTQQDIAMVPSEELSRQHAVFPFAPKIAGIKPGTFAGQVTVYNQHAGGAEVMAQPIDVEYTMVTSQVFSADPPAASLGQYVFVRGGGFVGGETGAGTDLELSGTFTKQGGSAVQVTMYLVPEFVEGRLVR
ncbi:MAG TPA: hypothetical protein VFS15_20435, partial [Kofleriaceae bacterium]|nr:hypothetical protein [Kofleriaceae bacterium]